MVEKTVLRPRFVSWMLSGLPLLWGRSMTCRERNLYGWMETAHGTRADGTRAQPHPYRAQVNEHSVPQQQQQVLQQSSPIRDFLGVPADAPQQQQQQGVPHRQAQQPGGMMGQHDATVTLQQVTTRVVTTSPPEDLPAPPDQPHGAQAMWIARLGEFFQRRVTQAAAAVAPVLERSPRPNFRAIPPAPSSWGASREAPLFTPEAEAGDAAMAQTSPSFTWARGSWTTTTTSPGTATSR